MTTTIQPYAEHVFHDGSRITVGRRRTDHEGRMIYRWTVEGSDGHELGQAANLLSGAYGVGGSPAEMLAALADFLSAYAEGRQYAREHGSAENADLLRDRVGEWAEDHADDLASDDTWICR